MKAVLYGCIYICYCFVFPIFQQDFTFRVVNKTSYTISNIRLYEYNMGITLFPNDTTPLQKMPINKNTAESVLMFYTGDTNYGIYIEKPSSGKAYTYTIDSIQPDTKNIFISTKIDTIR